FLRFRKREKHRTSGDSGIVISDFSATEPVFIGIEANNGLSPWPRNHGRANQRKAKFRLSNFDLSLKYLALSRRKNLKDFEANQETPYIPLTRRNHRLGERAS